MIQSSPTIITTFAIYLLAVFAIGVVAWLRTRNLADYILGGRRLGPWVAALSAQASDMSGWLLLGLPGYAYAAGLESGWLALGLLVGTYLNWKFVAERLRVATFEAGDSITLPEFFERRFADDSGLLRIITAAFILIFFTFYTSSGLVAGGKLFETVFGLPYPWAVAAGASVVVVYTFLGGFLAVSWTDALQGSMMFLAILGVALMGLVAIGGWSGVDDTLTALNPELLSAFTTASGDTVTVIGVASLLGWGLGYVGQPHILARFMAVDDAAHLRTARHIAMTWQTVALVSGIVVGLVGIGLVPELVGADQEKVFMHLAAALFHPAVAGVALAGILAAVMSTADSQLLVASSAVSEDFYNGVLKRRLLRRDAGEAELLWVGRSAVIVIAAVAWFLARDPDSSVLDLVAYAWAGFGAAFGPAIVMSLYWSEMNRAGAIAGILVGGVTVIVWGNLSGGPGGIFDLYEIIPGFGLSLIAIVTGSRIGSR
jgi:sodium/proline symporter